MIMLGNLSLKQIEERTGTQGFGIARLVEWRHGQLEHGIRRSAHRHLQSRENRQRSVA